MAASRLLSVDFEVFGKVQGVFFRKHTMKYAKVLGLVGWVQNTKSHTVVGQMQGPAEKVEDMKHWLSKEGSPKSVIDRCLFKNETVITTMKYKDFQIKP